MRSKTVVLQLILLSCITRTSGQVAAETQTVPQANPGRPTVSTPATLTPLGYLQFETGILAAIESTEFDTRLSANEVVKLTVAPRLQLLLPIEPFVHSRLSAGKGNHPGEVFAGAQGVLVPGKGKRPTISLSYFRRLYASPAPEVDIGTFRQSGLILLSDDLWGFHFDGNAIISEQIEANVHRIQYGQTLSISHPLKKFTISGEIWHFSQPFLNSNAVGNLWAAAYTLRNNLVVDIGFNRGLTKTSTQWEVFIGFTYLLPHRIWNEQ
ncbi:MAG: hypothetical protein ACJ74Z_00025 [Bryobacteraceae bacterium]